MLRFGARQVHATCHSIACTSLQRRHVPYTSFGTGPSVLDWSSDLDSIANNSGIVLIHHSHRQNHYFICRSLGTKGCSVALAATLGAVTAVQQVVADAYGLATPTGSHQGQLLLQDVLQVLCEQSISLVGKQAVNTALTVVPGAVQKFMTLLQVCPTLVNQS